MCSNSLRIPSFQDLLIMLVQTCLEVLPKYNNNYFRETLSQISLCSHNREGHLLGSLEVAEEITFNLNFHFPLRFRSSSLHLIQCLASNNLNNKCLISVNLINSFNLYNNREICRLRSISKILTPISTTYNWEY